MMVRRPFVIFALIAVGMVAAPGAADAQQAVKFPRIGYLSPIPHPREADFRQELRRLGYVEGESITIEYRSAQGNFDRLPELAAELVDLEVDVIVAQVTQAAIAAKKATATIPIVMIAVSDPVASGLVASLARPGGNVTGTSAVAAGVVGKQLELVRELVPGVSSVAALWNPANRIFQEQQLHEARAAAAELKLRVRILEARDAKEIDSAFETLAREPASALLLMGDPIFTTHARRIAELALEHGLPTVGSASVLAEAGVLLTYGPNYEDAFRGAAAYVDRILKGAKPAGLPVERSVRFDLVVNEKTATALGVTLPQSIVLRADQVVK
jgi:ABC-type uncharacterized transport system substrate-binding protein